MLKVRVRKRKKAPWNIDKLKCYALLMPPELGWYPKKYASFTFGFAAETYDPEYYASIFPRHMNSSVWRNKRKKLYTVRVPIKYKESAIKFLGRKKFWFHTRRYLWYARRNKRLL